MPGEKLKLNFSRNHHLSTYILEPGKLTRYSTGERAARAGQPPVPHLHPKVVSLALPLLSLIPTGKYPLRAGHIIIHTFQRLPHRTTKDPEAVLTLFALTWVYENLFGLRSLQRSLSQPQN